MLLMSFCFSIYWLLMESGNILNYFMYFVLLSEKTVSAALLWLWLWLCYDKVVKDGI